MDRPGKPDAATNEDPFVWTRKPWLFSYCHATQLRRGTRSDETHLQQGSRLFFCEGGEEARKGRLRIDTVFTVAKVHVWPEQGRVAPPGLAAEQDARWQRHLGHGIGDQPVHIGRCTYEATNPSGGDSFMPLAADGRPVLLAVRSVLPGLSKKVPERNPPGRSSYPLMLQQPEADDLLRHCNEAAVKRVV